MYGTWSCIIGIPQLNVFFTINLSIANNDVYRIRQYIFQLAIKSSQPVPNAGNVNQTLRIKDRNQVGFNKNGDGDGLTLMVSFFSLVFLSLVKRTVFEF